MNQQKRRQALARGVEGEAFVRRILERWGWQVLEERWQCRWGELDLVAQEPGTSGNTLVFVEVKARGRTGAWDPRLAVTAAKQQRLWRTAEQFLIHHEALAGCPCRFDVALVTFSAGGYRLQQYIKGAFEG